MKTGRRAAILLQIAVSKKRKRKMAAAAAGRETAGQESYQAISASGSLNLFSFSVKLVKYFGATLKEFSKPEPGWRPSVAKSLFVLIW